VLVGIPHTTRERERPNTTWPSADYRIQSAYIRALWDRANLRTTTYSDMVCGLTREAREAFLKAVIGAEGWESNGAIYVAQNRGELYDATVMAVYLCGYMPRLQAKHVKCGIVAVGKKFPTGAFLKRTALGEQPVWCVTDRRRQDGQVMAYRDRTCHASRGRL
jgi:hypothetical protein